jgi:hypothetical protein
MTAEHRADEARLGTANPPRVRQARPAPDFRARNSISPSMTHRYAAHDRRTLSASAATPRQHRGGFSKARSSKTSSKTRDRCDRHRRRRTDAGDQASTRRVPPKHRGWRHRSRIGRTTRAPLESPAARADSPLLPLQNKPAHPGRFFRAGAIEQDAPPDHHVALRRS